MSVSISVKSRKFECSFVLESKLSIVVGDSGAGKSQSVGRVNSNSGAVEVDITEGYAEYR